MRNKDLFRLEHIRNCIVKVEHIASMLHTQDNFETKWIEQDAIIRNLEVMGEAVIHISDDLKQKYPNVSWKEIRGLRNFVTHQYFGIELNEIWSTVTNDIPLLKNQIQKIIEDIENSCAT